MGTGRRAVIILQWFLVTVLRNLNTTDHTVTPAICHYSRSLYNTLPLFLKRIVLLFLLLKHPFLTNNRSKRILSTEWAHGLSVFSHVKIVMDSDYNIYS